MMLNVFKEITDVWAWLISGGLVGVALLAAGFYMFNLRQLFFGLAIGAFGATAFAGFMVVQEREVCAAKAALVQATFERINAERVDESNRDAAARQAELLRGAQKDKDELNGYIKRLEGRPSCKFGASELPPRRVRKH